MENAPFLLPDAKYMLWSMCAVSMELAGISNVDLLRTGPLWRANARDVGRIERGRTIIFQPEDTMADADPSAGLEYK